MFVAPPQSGVTVGEGNTSGLDFGAVHFPAFSLRLPTFELPNMSRMRRDARVLLDNGVAPRSEGGARVLGDAFGMRAETGAFAVQGQREVQAFESRGLRAEDADHYRRLYELQERLRAEQQEQDSKVMKAERDAHAREIEELRKEMDRLRDCIRKCLETAQLQQSQLGPESPAPASQLTLRQPAGEAVRLPIQGAAEAQRQPAPLVPIQRIGEGYVHPSNFQEHPQTAPPATPAAAYRYQAPEAGPATANAARGAASFERETMRPVPSYQAAPAYQPAAYQAAVPGAAANPPLPATPRARITGAVLPRR